jgi:hypothetical protein
MVHIFGGIYKSMALVELLVPRLGRNLNAQELDLVARYKRRVAGTYRAITPEEIPTLVGPLAVTRKIDGELWFLGRSGDGPFLVNPKGRTITAGLPILEQAHALAPGTIVAGELHVDAGTGRERVGDLSAALAAGAAQAQSVKVGIIAPFSGPFAHYGALMKAGAEAYVASQGGNAATQTMTVAVRALATGELGNWNMSRFMTRELTVSLINGAAFALITGFVAAVWFGNQGLGLVIGLAIIVNLFAAALAGAAIPIALDKIGIDPAVSSGTFVTTVTDVVGFFAFLGIATLWFSL